MTSTAYLDIQQLNLKYGAHQVLDDMALRITAPGRYCLYGSNGSGKSSLMKLLMGMIRTSTGDVKVLGHSIAGHARSEIAYMPSNLHHYPDSTLETLVRTVQHFYADFNRDEALSLFEAYKFPLGKRLAQFSKGQRTLIFMVLCLCRDAKLYLFDEPFGGLDVRVRNQMNELFEKFPVDDRVYIISTHEITDMESLFSHIILLEDGKIRLFDETDTLKTRFGTTVSDLLRRQLYVS